MDPPPELKPGLDSKAMRSPQHRGALECWHWGLGLFVGSRVGALAEIWKTP